ncbi:methyltransferase domain-containing protein [Kribbella sp. NPDC056861]|uniref:methyltransferase domain-containing protein n=1 Tax=Kribbella sp. NPDC056861 TaxID=3154857 RepID=UPI003435E971
MADTAMHEEFDSVAEWTADAVETLGPEYAIPAGCRGSASPASLAWLAEACGLGAGDLLLDLGAGVGGPAAWVSRRYGVQAVLVDPMPGACRAAARLFGLPVAAADGLAVPLKTGSVDVAWSLGVLCTVDDKLALLQELHRVLAPGGSLGLLVLVAQQAGPLEPMPEGNVFPLQDELDALLDKAEFDVREQVAAPVEVPLSWSERADRVDEVIGAAHGRDDGYLEAEEQSRRVGVLLSTGQVSTQLIHAVARRP